MTDKNSWQMSRIASRRPLPKKRELMPGVCISDNTESSEALAWRSVGDCTPACKCGYHACGCVRDLSPFTHNNNPIVTGLAAASLLRLGTVLRWVRYVDGSPYSGAPMFYRLTGEQVECNYISDPKACYWEHSSYTIAEACRFAFIVEAPEKPEVHTGKPPETGDHEWAKQALASGHHIRCISCDCSKAQPDVGVEWRIDGIGGYEWMAPNRAHHGDQWRNFSGLRQLNEWYGHRFEVVEAAKPAAHSGELDWYQAKVAMREGKDVYSGTEYWYYDPYTCLFYSCSPARKNAFPSNVFNAETPLTTTFCRYRVVES